MKASPICIDHEIKNGKPLRYPYFNFIKFRHGTDKDGSDEVITINRIKEYSIEQPSFRSLYRFNKNYNDLHGRVLGIYRDVCIADYLPFDFERTEEAKSFYLGLNSLGVAAYQMQYYYSGDGKFSINIPITLFGVISPSEELPRILAETASLLDNNQTPNLYRKNSMIRIPNTVHEGTGLYKVQLTSRQLYGLSDADYKSLAKKPGELFGSEAIHPNNTLVNFFAEAKANIQNNSIYDAKVGEKMMEELGFA